jgi:hypothetical protein
LIWILKILYLCACPLNGMSASWRSGRAMKRSFLNSEILCYLGVARGVTSSHYQKWREAFIFSSANHANGNSQIGLIQGGTFVLFLASTLLLRPVKPQPCFSVQVAEFATGHFSLRVFARHGLRLFERFVLSLVRQQPSLSLRA